MQFKDNPRYRVGRIILGVDYRRVVHLCSHDGRTIVHRNHVEEVRYVERRGEHSVGIEVVVRVTTAKALARLFAVVSGLEHATRRRGYTLDTVPMGSHDNTYRNMF